MTFSRNSEETLIGIVPIVASVETGNLVLLANKMEALDILEFVTPSGRRLRTIELAPESAKTLSEFANERFNPARGGAEVVSVVASVDERLKLLIAFGTIC